MTIFQKREHSVFLCEIDGSYAIYNPLTFQLVFSQNPDFGRCYLQSQGKMALENIVSTEREKFSGQKIHVLSIIPTFACNNRCGYCSLRHTPSHIYPLSMEISQAKQAIDLFFEWSDPAATKEIMIFGGEPLCNLPVTKAVIEYGKQKNDCSISLFTNGTMIDDETARVFGRFDVNVIVSIDGGEKEHNQARPLSDGVGSYQRAVRGYLRAKESGCSMGISMQIGRHNVHSFSESLNELYCLLEPERISIGSNFHPLHGGVKNPFQVDTLKATSLLLDIFYQYKEKGICIEQVDRRIRPFVAENYRGKDCAGCGQKIVALPDGRLGFCEYLAYPGEAYMPADQFSPDSMDYKKYCRISPLFKDECLECPAISICGGGCFYNALMFNGSVTGPDILNCEQTLYILEWMVKKLWDNLKYKLQHKNVHLVTQREKESILGTFDPTQKVFSCNNGFSKIAE